MKKLHIAILLLIIAFGATISLLSANIDSLTYDEVAHIGAGYSYLTEHDYRLNPEHPPLLKVLSALPLLIIDPVFPVKTIPSWNVPYDLGEYGQWDAGRLLLHQSGNDTDALTFWARIPIVLLFSGIGLFVFFWTTKITTTPTLQSGSTKNPSYAAPFLALILWICNPNILGHNHLVTTDVGAAGAFSLSIYFFLQFLKSPTYKNVIFFGLVFGIASTIKFSLGILIPFFGLMTVIYVALSYNGQKTNQYVLWERIKKYCSRITLVGIVALTTIFIIYTPFSVSTPKSVLQNIAPLKIHNIERPIDAWTQGTVLALNDVSALRPLALYVYGLTQVFHRVAGGNNTFFLGTVSPNQADPLYFPTVFTLKEPLLYLFVYLSTTTLILYGLMKLFTNNSNRLRKKYNTSLKLFFLQRFTQCTLIAFIIFYSTLAISGNLTIGIRHLFPLYPPIFILCASILISYYRVLHASAAKKLAQILYVILSIGLIIQTIHAYPGYLSFFNTLAGGTKQGYKYVVDSNADWGQGTKRLLAYLKEREITQIRMQYFGGDNVTDRFENSGIKILPWVPDKRPIEPGYYIISTTLLQQSIFSEGATVENSYLWLQNYTPLSQIDSSLLIFYVPKQNSL